MPLLPLGLQDIGPPPALAVAILASLLIAVLLVALAWGPATFRPPGRRFKAAVGMGWLALVLGLFWLRGLGMPVEPIDVLAGVAVVVAATLLAFIAWSLLAWGFTLNMLLALVDEERGLDLALWAERYVGDGGMSRLTADRLEVLVKSRFAVRSPARGYTLTRLGRTAGRLLAAVRLVLGFGRR